MPPTSRQALVAGHFRTHYGALLRQVRRQGSIRLDVAEDACSHAWTVLLTSEHVDLEPFPFQYMLTVAKRQAWHLARHDVDVDLDTLPERIDPTNTARLVEQRERMAAVHALPERERRFLLRKSLGYSYEEIARDEHASYTTANRVLTSARARLRALDAA